MWKVRRHKGRQVPIIVNVNISTLMGEARKSGSRGMHPVLVFHCVSCMSFPVLFAFVAAMKGWYEAGHVCWDDNDVIDGIPTGIVRASFGHGSSSADADAIADVIERHFLVSKEKISEPAVMNNGTARKKVPAERLSVKSMFVYPIKSCAGFQVTSWQVGPGGLALDRHWALVDVEGRPLTLRRYPGLARIYPIIDLTAGILRVTAGEDLKGVNGADVLELPLPAEFVRGPAQKAQRIWPSKKQISEWFAKHLGVHCTLAEHGSLSQNGPHGLKEGAKPAVGSFANEAQVLIVKEASLHHLQAQSGFADISAEAFTARFRPNIVLGSSDGVGAVPYEEEAWCGVSMCGVEFEVVGPCPRCQMVCVDPSNGRYAESLYCKAVLRCNLMSLVFLCCGTRVLLLQARGSRAAAESFQARAVGARQAHVLWNLSKRSRQARGSSSRRHTLGWCPCGVQTQLLTE